MVELVVTVPIDRYGPSALCSGAHTRRIYRCIALKHPSHSASNLLRVRAFFCARNIGDGASIAILAAYL